MGKEEWPETRERLLEDIEAFARLGPPATEESAPVQVAPPVAANAPTTPPSAGKPAVAVAAEAAKTAPGASPAASSSLLNTLKQKAEAKRQGDQQDSTLKSEQLQQVSASLGACFHYLNDLVQQLNILKPAYGKTYTLFGFGEFDELAWQEGRADYRMREGATEDRVYDQVTLRFRLASPKRFNVTREHPVSEKLRKALFDNGINFGVDEMRNDRGFVERATFSGACEVKAGLLIAGDFETGKLMLRTRNIERFGVSEYQFAPQALNHEALDELVRLILGEANQFNLKYQRTA